MIIRSGDFEKLEDVEGNFFRFFVAFGLLFFVHLGNKGKNNNNRQQSKQHAQKLLRKDEKCEIRGTSLRSNVVPAAGVFFTSKTPKTPITHKPSKTTETTGKTTVVVVVFWRKTKRQQAKETKKATCKVTKKGQQNYNNFNM